VKISNTNQSQNTGKEKQSNASKSVKNNEKVQQNNANPEKDIK
jgi:zona occludens toxin (predicted ATPase)